MTQANWPDRSSKSQSALNQVKTIPLGSTIRDQLINEGVATLDHLSLISILLGSKYGSEQDSLLLAQRLLQSLGSLKSLAEASMDQLCLVRGIGPAKASRLLAASELMKRVYQSGEPKATEPLTSISLDQQLSNQVRLNWDGINPLLIACSLSSTETYTQEQMITHALDASHTLSLSTNLGDIELHARWLAKLLLQDTGRQWTIISLRSEDQLLAIEIEGVAHLLELAHAMNVSIENVLVVSPHYFWSPIDSQGGKA
jgi:hypothetical protein